MSKETTVELSEKPAADVQVPVVAYLRADSHGNPLWTEDCVCQEPIYPNDPEGSDARDISMPMVRQADVQVALVAKEAEIAALKKKVGAYQLLTESQDVRIATVRKLRDEASEAIGSLASERLANAMLTNEIDALKAERDGLREALEEMVSCFDPYAWGSPENKKDALQNARAAIAKEQSK